MRWLLLLVMGTVFLCGCAARHDRAVATCPDQAASPSLACEQQPPAPPPRQFSGLVFDRYPGPFAASDFAWRSDWPDTESYQRRSETIFYREHFHDIQGPGFGTFDFSYRRFDTYRYGEAVR